MDNSHTARLRRVMVAVGASLVAIAVALLLLALSSGGSPSPPIQPVIRSYNPPAVPAQPAAPAPRPASPPAAVRHVARAPARAQALTLARMIGQQLMVRMDGTTPDSGLLQRVRRGEVGGVILYSENIASQSQTRALIATLQRAARAGGNPPLLISTDQEGGQVARIPWAGPSLSPPEMGTRGAAVARAQGIQTGAALHSTGINQDLAPVVDVASSSNAFIWQQGRSFGMSPTTVTNSAVPFATGLQRAGVAATVKHYPGVGSAAVDTDYKLNTLVIRPADLQPYGAAIASNVASVMVSTAVYPRLDPSRAPAALSPAIVTGLLRGQQGFRGVVITDDLERPTGTSTAGAVIRAAAAGDDIILVSSTEAAGGPAFNALLSAAWRGAIPAQNTLAAYRRILTLKHFFAGA